jgi:hypothetical protein
MLEDDLAALKQAYERDDYVSGVRLLSAEDAAERRQAMEETEVSFGPLQYLSKVHTILRSPLALATMLVRGRDAFRHFSEGFSAKVDLEPAPLARQTEREARSISIVVTQ